MFVSRKVKTCQQRKAENIGRSNRIVKDHLMSAKLMALPFGLAGSHCPSPQVHATRARPRPHFLSQCVQPVPVLGQGFGLAGYAR